MTFQMYLVRHATSTRSHQGVWGRLVDVPLADGFPAQLAATRSFLAAVPTPAVFTSPLLRCRQTAQFLFPGRTVEVVDQLRAYHSGVFESRSVEYVAKRFPEYPLKSFRERFLVPEFGEESIADQADRVAEGLGAILARCEGGAWPAVVVAHYSTINIIAHLSRHNWDQSSYADGAYDIAEGDVLPLSVDLPALAAGLRDHLEKR